MSKNAFHYKFEDLKPVTGRDIDMGFVEGEGCLDSNDEYYPRQKVDEAIRELTCKFGNDTISKDDLKKQCIHLKKLRCKHNMFDCLRSIQKLSIASADYELGIELGMPVAEQARATITAKVAFWTKWVDRWQKLADCFGGKCDG